MKTVLKQSPTNALKILFISVLVAGILLRFVNLDTKVYWHDEAYTSLWLSGHSLQEVLEGVFNGEVVTVDEVQHYQQISPDSGVVDTVKLLAEHDPQHSPLYYIIARLKANFLGDSITSIRITGAILSLISLPLSYWLGMELFEGKIAACVLTGLTAISPFHILYAQEARQYGLLIATTFFASAALLRAVRKPTRFNWSLYALSVVLNLYTSTLAIFLIFAQGIYVLIVQRFRLTKALLMYAAAVFVGCLSFIPWLIVMAQNSARAISAISWVTLPKPPARLIYSWIENAGQVLFVFRLDDSNFPLIISIILTLITFIFLVFCSYFLYQNYPRRTWLYIFVIGGITASAMLVPDLAFGGIRSTINRYSIPAWISIQLIVAAYLTSVVKLMTVPMSSLNNWTRSIGKTVFAVILAAILVSDLLVLQANDAWTKQINKDLPEIADTINTSPEALVVSGDLKANFGQILALSHRLAPTTKLLLVQDPTMLKVPAEFESVWLFDPSNTLKKYIQEIEPERQLVYQQSPLWKFGPAPQPS